MSMPHNVVCLFIQTSLFETRIGFDILDSVSTIRNNSRIVNYSKVSITTLNVTASGLATVHKPLGVSLSVSGTFLKGGLHLK